MKKINLALKIILMISVVIFALQLIQVVGYQSLIELRNSSFWLVHIIVSFLTMSTLRFGGILSAIFDSIGILGISIIVLILVLMLDDDYRSGWMKWICYYIIGLVVVVCSLLLWYSNNYYDNRLFLMIRLCGWFLIAYYGIGIGYLVVKDIRKVVIK